MIHATYTFHKWWLLFLQAKVLTCTAVENKLPRIIWHSHIWNHFLYHLVDGSLEKRSTKHALGDCQRLFKKKNWRDNIEGKWLMRQHWRHLCVQRWHNDSYKVMELWIFFTYSFRHDYEVMKFRILLGNHYKDTGLSQSFEAKKGLNPDVTCLHGLCWLKWVSFWERLLLVVPDLSTTSANVVFRVIRNSPS